MKGRGANAPLPFFCSTAVRVSINSENDHAVPHPDINLLVAWSPHQFCALRVALIKRRCPQGLLLSHASIASVEYLTDSTFIPTLPPMAAKSITDLHHALS